MASYIVARHSGEILSRHRLESAALTKAHLLAPAFGQLIVHEFPNGRNGTGWPKHYVPALPPLPAQNLTQTQGN